MKLSSFLLTLATIQGVLSSGCLDDNCARAVTGTRPGKVPDVTSRRQDCSNFMKITVTPATSTISTTTTVTTTTTAGVPNKAKRVTTIGLNSIPTYASACSGPVRYSSACSCWGIPVQTITAATPLTTTTITATATVTIPAACPTGLKSCGGTCIGVSSDPHNCGACGVTCPAGSTCVNGACSTPSCDGKTCGQFANCNGVDTCFCFTTADASGFCAQDAQCADLPDCVTNADCGEGSICAVNSCCVRNVCLTINCANPARVLMRFAKKRAGCSAASC